MLERPALGAGRAVPFAGVPHDLQVSLAELTRRRSRIEHDDALAPVIRVLLAPGDERPLRDVLEPWLREQARAAIQRRVELRGRELGIVPTRLAVRDQASRWGSASRRGTLSFSWRLVLTPPAVLDYVVVHELAHLKIFGHGPRFWALVRRHVPGTDAARRWLREHESDLRAALD